MKLALIIILFAIISSCTNNRTKETKTITEVADSLDGKDGYLNPVDNKIYIAERGFKEYNPEDGVRKYEGRVQPINIVLLTDQNELEKVITVQELSDFIGGADSIMMKELANVKDSGQILFQYSLYADKKAKIDLSFKGVFKNEDLNRVFQEIELYSDEIRTERDSFLFQCIYAVNEEQHQNQ